MSKKEYKIPSQEYVDNKVKTSAEEADFTDIENRFEATTLGEALKEMAGEGRTTENLKDISDKLEDYASIQKIKLDEPMSEEELLTFMEEISEGIYLISTYRHGQELFLKGVVTEEDLETGEEVQRLKKSRIISNGTSWEWSDGLSEWVLSAGGGGGGGSGGGTLSPIRLYVDPPGASTNISSAINSTLILGIRYQNALITTGTLRVLRNGSLILVKDITTGVTTYDVGSHVQGGTNSFEFEVSDIYSNSAKVTYMVEGISISVMSAFNDADILPPYGEIIYSVMSAGAREAIITLNGQQEIIPSQTIVNIWQYEGLSHGTHELTIQARTEVSEGEFVYSNKLEYLLIVAEEGNNTPIISSKFDTVTAYEGITLNVDYLAYQQDKELVTVNFLIDDEPAGSAYVDRKRQVWNVAGLSAGNHILKIVCGVTEVSFLVEIEELDIEFTNVQDSSLKLYLDASGKANTDIDKESWVPSYGTEVPIYFQKFNFSTNGWIDDGLLFSGLASMVVTYKPFVNEVSNAGKTFEFEIKTKNAYGQLIPFIDCFNNGRGFQIFSDRAVISSSTTKSIAFFKEDQRVKISFVIDKNNRTVLTYIDGVMSGIDRIATDSFFQQASPQNIRINIDNVGGVLYSFRTYDRSLTRQEILQNYLFDEPNINVKLNEYAFSDILDGSGKVDYNKTKEKIPTLRIRGYQKDSSGNYLPVTSDFRPKVDIYLDHPFDTTKNFSFNTVEIRTQGTSTLVYPVKNYRFTLQTGDSCILDVNETRPTRILNIKADYMESSLSTNVGICRLINETLYDNLLPIQETDPLARSTTYGYPIAVFLDDGSNISFWGVYNLNTDKSDPGVFGFYDSNGYPESRKFENIRNVGNSAGAFIRKPSLSDNQWFEEVSTDFEGHYPKQSSSSATKPNYQPLMDMIEFVSDYPGLDDPEIEDYKEEFKKRIDLEYVIKYLLVTLVFGAVDSFGKDMMLNTWGQDEGFYKWFLTFYDLDTCLGIDNTGNMLEPDGITPKYDYDIELVDEGAYAQAESRLWEVVSELFADEIETYYEQLRPNVFSFDHIWSYIHGKQISKISKALYNENAVRKYVEAPGAEQYVHMLHGDRQQQISRWLTNRFSFLDSKFKYEMDRHKIALRLSCDDASLIGFELTSDTHQWLNVLVGNLIDPQSYGSTRAKAGVPAIVSPSYTQQTSLQFVEGVIYNAERIVNLGDINNNPNFILEQLKIEDAPNIVKCNLGKDSPDSSLTLFTLGENTQLEELDLRNNAGLAGILDLSACVNLRKLDLRGTNFTSVEFPVGGVLEECYLPSSISTITILDQPYLDADSFFIEEGAEISYIRIENSPGVDLITILTSSSADVAIRLLGADMSLYGSSILDNLIVILDTAKGIDGNGNIINTPQIYGKIQILDYEDNIDLGDYEDAFPNVTFSKFTLNTEFTVDSTLNSRGNYKLITYNGSDEFIEVTTDLFNSILSLERPYVMGLYGWAPIDEIGVGVFGANIQNVHLTEDIYAVNNGAFTEEFTGVITTELKVIPYDWNVGENEIILDSEKAFIDNNILMSKTSKGIAIAKLLEVEDDVLDIPSSIIVNGNSYPVYHLSSRTFTEVDGEISELHIPSSIISVGKRLTTPLANNSFIWVVHPSRPVDWQNTWNQAGHTVYFNAPATRKTFNFHEGGEIVETYEFFGFLERHRVKYFLGKGVYDEIEKTKEIEYPYVVEEETDLYLGKIIAEIFYAYDEEKDCYYVEGYDKSRMEADGSIRLLIKKNHNDRVNGNKPVSYINEGALGSDNLADNARIYEVTFAEGSTLFEDGFPEKVFYKFVNCEIFNLPSGVIYIPDFAFTDNEFIFNFNFKNVEVIGESAFEGASLEEIALRPSLYHIHTLGLAISTLNKVWLYSSNLTIEDFAFDPQDNKFREAFNEFDDGVFEKQPDGSWTQVHEVPTGEEYFTINSRGLITSYDVDGGLDIVLPKTVNEIPVVGIAKNGMEDLGLTSIFFPYDITTLEESCLAGNNFTEVEIPDSVTLIEKNALLGLDSTQITLGAGYNTFAIFEDGGETYVGHICNFAETEIVIPKEIKRIKSEAFKNSLLEIVTFQRDLEEVEDRAFIGSTLLTTFEINASNETLILGEDLVISGDNSLKTAFENNEVEDGFGEYKFEDGSWGLTESFLNRIWYYEDFEYKPLHPVSRLCWYNEADPSDRTNTAASPGTFHYVNATLVNTTYKFYPHKVLGKQMFYLQTWATRLAEQAEFHPEARVHLYAGGGSLGIPGEPLSDSWTVIHEHGAIGATSLKELISFPNIFSLRSSFSDCNRLTTIPPIPNTGFTNMQRAFRDCVNLTSEIVIPNSVVNIEEAFLNCKKLNSPISIPDGVTDMFSAFKGCTNLTDVTKISKDATNLENAFWGCTNLVNVADITGESVYSLTNSFRGCTNLVNAPELPEEVGYISSLFSGCTNLVNAPSSLPKTYTYGSVFYDCCSLEEAPPIPETATSISQMFRRCTNLVNAPEMLGGNVKEMTLAFDGCTNLKNGYKELPKKLVNMWSTFADCSKLETFPERIPDSVENLRGTFEGCYKLEKSPDLGSGVTSLYRTFWGCSNLTEGPKSIPPLVTNMETTFLGCVNLTGNIALFSNRVEVEGGMNDTFGREMLGASYPEINFFIPEVGYNATHNSMASADYSSVDGHYGVTLKNLSEFNPFSTDGNGSITSYEHYAGLEVEIPVAVGAETITGIASNAFRGKPITSVDMMEAEITYIGGFAFAGTNISSVMIPTTVTEVEDKAFLDCENLEEIMIFAEKDVLTLGYDLVEEGNNSLKDAFEAEVEHNGAGIYHKDEFGNWFWNGVAWPYTWHESDFDWELRTNVSIEYPEGYRTFDEVAYVTNFANSSKTSYNIPAEIDGKQVIMIGNATHSTRDVLEEVAFHPESLVLNVTIVNNQSRAKSLVGLHRSSVDTSPFGNFKELKSVYSYPSYVYSMSYTFFGCSNLVNVPTEIPNSVSSMSFTFFGCSNLVNAPTTIGNSVTSLAYTFYGCSNLVNGPTVIGNSVNSMSYTFFGCSNLVNVPTEIPNSVTDMYSTFNGCSSLVNAPTEIPNSVTDMRYTFYGCSRLVNAPTEIPNSVSSMSSTFRGCSNLVNGPTVIGNSVSSMSSTFNGCSNLVNAPTEIPNSVTDMYSTFNGCSSLVDGPTEIPNSVTDMRSTFSGCFSLVNGPTEIPNSVTDMYQTFYGCSNLVNGPTVIGNSVTNMSSTFNGCSNLVNPPTIIGNSVSSMSFTFNGCSRLLNAPSIPDSVIYMDSSFANCTNLTIAPEIPNSVTNMAHTFNGCSSLVDGPTEIPNSVTSMSSTFYGCSNLVNGPTEIPNSVTNMASTFNGCSNLVNPPTIIGNSVTDMYYTFFGCSSLTGNIGIYSNKITLVASCFYLTSLPKDIYIPFEGTTYDRFSASYGSGQNGVTLKDINTYTLPEEEE